MRRRFSFHEETFKALPLKQQHKKCSELLEALFQNPKNSNLIEEYLKWRGWLGLSSRPLSTPEEIADCYHEHVGIDGLPLKLKQSDRSYAEEWLNITTFLDRPRSLHNIGSVIRTIEAFRLGPLVLSEDSYRINTERLKKSAMGAEKEVQFEYKSINDLPRPLIALETVESAIPYSSFSFPNTGTLLLGNEETGIRKEYLDKADFIITIPMRGKKNSLNVSNAFAIIAASITARVS